MAQYFPDSVKYALRLVSLVTFLATLGIGGVFAVARARTWTQRRPVVIAVALMAAAVAMGIARGLIGESPTGHAFAHGQFIVPYVVVFGMPIPTARQWERLLAAMLAGFTVPAVYSLFILAANSGTQLPWYTRILPNGVSFCGVACLLWLAYGARTGHKYAYGFAAACGLAIFVSGTRGWILALLFALLLYLFAFRPSNIALRRRWIGAGVLGLLLLSPLIVRLNRVSALVDRTRRDLTNGSDLRARQARNLLTEFTDAPIFGSGLGYKNPLLARPGIPLEVPRPYLVELSYLNLLAKLGLVGFSLLAVGMALILRYLHQAARTAIDSQTMAAMYASTVYLLLTSLLNPTFESVYLHLFIAIALLGALRTNASGRGSPKLSRCTAMRRPTQYGLDVNDRIPSALPTNHMPTTNMPPDGQRTPAAPVSPSPKVASSDLNPFTAALAGPRFSDFVGESPAHVDAAIGFEEPTPDVPSESAAPQQVAPEELAPVEVVPAETVRSEQAKPPVAPVEPIVPPTPVVTPEPIPVPEPSPVAKPVAAGATSARAPTATDVDAATGLVAASGLQSGIIAAFTSPPADGSVAILMVALRNLDDLEAEHGRVVASRVLRELARRFRSDMPEATTARFATTAFAALVVGNAASMQDLIERSTAVLFELLEPVVAGALAVEVDVAASLAQSKPGEDAQAFVDRANTGLQRAVRTPDPSLVAMP